MQEQQPITHLSPFSQGLFFPDHGRKSTLEALRNAVVSSASLITCIGEEGYGKTTLCNILEKEFSTTYLVISFPYSVESFDYVLKIIAQKLHLDFSMEVNAQGSGHILMEIIKALQEQGKRLLILFDEAEKLYLATLERIRKMIDLANEQEVLLQIILFGRMGLQTHIEQLALCTFKDIKELHLTLPPITEEDTFRYLNFCMQQNPGSAKKDIFSREVAQKILTVSHGNFRKINSLAKDSLQSSSYNGDDTSFMVLLEHVRDADDQVISGNPKIFRLPALSAQNRIMLGTGALLVTMLLIFFLNKETTISPPSIPQKAEISTQKKTPQTSPNKKDPIATPNQLTRATEPITKAAQPAPVTEPITLPDRPAPMATTEPVAKAAPSPAPVKEAVDQLGHPAPMAVTEPAPKAAQPDPAPVVEPASQPVHPAPMAATEPIPKPSSVEIAPLVEKKSSGTQAVMANKLSNKKDTIPLLTAVPLTKNKELLKGKKGLKPNLTQQLPQKSLAAADSWLAGEKNDRFTLQLIVLAANQANGKLKEILHNEENQKGSEKFIVLKKSSAPATFILFYGEYPTMDAARKARNNLPQSLQKYTPYPVAIKQAVEKSKQ